jgi:predicted ferric reductase
MGGTLPNVVRLALLACAVIAGGVLALRLPMPSGARATADQMYSEHMWWYMGRASGFMAFGLLLGSVLLGLGVSSRVFDGLLIRSWVYDMHQFLSVFVLIAMSFHALILLPDPYVHFTLIELLVPFASAYRPIAVGLGAIVLYGSIAVALSFYAKRWIGQRGWRALHYASVALFGGVLVHGTLAGTDSHETWAQLVYLAGGLAVLFFTFFRILAARHAARTRPPAARQAAPPFARDGTTI